MRDWLYRVARNLYLNDRKKEKDTISLEEIVGERLYKSLCECSRKVERNKLTLYDANLLSSPTAMHLCVIYREWKIIIKVSDVMEYSEFVEWSEKKILPYIRIGVQLHKKQTKDMCATKSGI